MNMAALGKGEGRDVICYLAIEWNMEVYVTNVCFIEVGM